MSHYLKHKQSAQKLKREHFYLNTLEVDYSQLKQWESLLDSLESTEWVPVQTFEDIAYTREANSRYLDVVHQNLFYKYCAEWEPVQPLYDINTREVNSRYLDIVHHGPWHQFYSHDSIRTYLECLSQAFNPDLYITVKEKIAEQKRYIQAQLTKGLKGLKHLYKELLRGYRFISEKTRIFIDNIQHRVPSAGDDEYVLKLNSKVNFVSVLNYHHNEKSRKKIYGRFSDQVNL